jgi:hypothetical protein
MLMLLNVFLLDVFLIAAATPPEIVKPLRNANSIQNHNAQFQCTVTGNPKPTITWQVHVLYEDIAH